MFYTNIYHIRSNLSKNIKKAESAEEADDPAVIEGSVEEMN